MNSHRSTRNQERQLRNLPRSTRKAGKSKTYDGYDEPRRWERKAESYLAFNQNKETRGFSQGCFRRVLRIGRHSIHSSVWEEMNLTIRSTDCRCIRWCIEYKQIR